MTRQKKQLYHFDQWGRLVPYHRPVRHQPKRTYRRKTSGEKVAMEFMGILTGLLIGFFKMIEKVFDYATKK